MKRTIESMFYRNRKSGKKGLIVFLNAGDPDMATTREILRVLDYNQVDAVELCVAFPRSFTDGPVVQRSHARALANEVTLEQVLDLVRWAEKQIGIPIILLADYSHTVKPIKLKSYLENCHAAGVKATLIHGLPPMLRQEYLKIARELGIETVMSFYLNSLSDLRDKTYQEAQGFIYVVSKYGRSGTTIEFNQEVCAALESIRKETEMPLAVGFGVKHAEHLKAIYSTGFDAAIVGSAITEIIEKNLAQPQCITEAINLYLQRTYFPYWFPASRLQYSNMRVEELC